MAANATEVVVRLGDTILDIAHVEFGETYRYGPISLVVRDDLVVVDEAAVGLAEVSVMRVARPLRSLPHQPHGDRRTIGYLGVSLAVHVMVWALAMDMPPEQLGIGVGRPAVAGPTIRSGGGAVSSGTAEPRPHVPMALAATPAARVRSRKAWVRDRSAALVGPTDIVNGFDDQATGEPLDGGDHQFGSSRSGFGESSSNIIGDDRYATLVAGRQQQVGDYWSGGGGIGAGATRNAVAPTVILCGGPAPCVMTGDLDKAIIRRYIRRRLAQIQYCYEKELLAEPELAGAVTLEFLIGADGKVVEVAAHGMQDAVAECVATVIRKIEFPRSATRSSTRVNYPFEFRQSGS